MILDNEEDRGRVDEKELYEKTKSLYSWILLLQIPNNPKITASSSFEMRVADAEAETATEHSTPVLITQLQSLERHGSEVYTQYIFKLFQDEILRESALVVANRVDKGEVCRLYYLEHYARRESNWTVEYNPVDNQIKCCCLMFESFGLPCCHMISVMKYEHLLAIPESLIMQRWTKRARPQQPTIGQISPSMTSMARYGILSSGYNLMSFYASHTHESFQHARQVSHEMTSWMRERWEKVKKLRTSDVGERSSVGSLFGVADPLIVKTKGNPGSNAESKGTRKARKCRVCQCIGHDKRTCPKFKSKKYAVMNTRKRKAEVTQTRKSKRQLASKDPMSSQTMDLVMKTRKRKAKAPTQTSKSKRQVQSKDLPLSLNESSETRTAIHKTIVEGVQMSAEHLGSYATRAVVCERYVAIWELTKSQIPHVVSTSELKPICEIEGSSNKNLVREFYAGIDRSTTDLHKETLTSFVRGVKIVVTPDALAKFRKFKRPSPDEPLIQAVKKYGWKEVWATMLKKGCEPNESNIIYVNTLEQDFVFLHHLFWWNVNPKPPLRSLTKDQARMIFAIYNGTPPDIAMLWFCSIYAVYCKTSSVASLPLGVLLTQFMLNEYGVVVDPDDDWQVQKSPLGRATIGKSEGQSKLHRVSKCPNLATVEGNNDLLLSIHENISDVFDLLVDIKKKHVRLEKNQLEMVQRMTRIEKKQGINKGNGVESSKAVEDDDESGDDEGDGDESGGDESGDNEGDGNESDGDDEESESQDEEDENESQSEGDDEDED
ncbi:hypothetical protein Vadar_004048 [Vaccinium darrowii]|uniref:Uncharacterized protein n=1 Tax=Vaccinium darrowii TaxID=229202 RepID=A0ACB7Z1K4_9ERIC|nr:hypothetical protein Vadar_004048 [Vaccinium darrowii]